METFLFYLLRASVLMALFFGFYKLFFGKNTFHNFNRLSLISVVMLVAVLPVFRFNLIPEKKAEPVVIQNLPMDFSNIPVVEISELPGRQIEIPWLELLSVIFVLGFLFSLVRYLIGLSQLIGIIRKSEKQTLADNTVLCVTNKEISPFSWMKYIVMSRKDVSADNRAIINHERAHIHLQHSADMIFFDLFTCLFWFNPFSWLLRREIQSVHEYQADEQVLNNGIDAKQYQLLLIRKSVGEHKFALANNFRQRDLHKRITMMMKTKSNKRMKWNYTVALPVLFLAMVALSVPKLNAQAEVKLNQEEETVLQSLSGDAISEEFKDIIIYDGSKKYTFEDIKKMSPKELADARISIKNNNEKITVSGMVVNQAGKPVPNVIIVNESNNSGTVSDAHGKFTLNTKKAETISFKMIGYKVQKVTFTKPETNFKLTLEKGEGESKELITVNIERRDDASNAAQDKSKFTVSGIVRDKKEPIAGVVILIKGSNLGTVTDTQGKFVLKAQKNDALNFMMIGYKSREYVVERAQNNIVIELLPDGNTELIIKDFAPLQREQPIYILDGKTISGAEIQNIKPVEIESIDVLKGASATALYGSRAINGVVIITSKKRNSTTLTLNQTNKDRPLIVINEEKMPKNFDLNTIQASDIESISILKDKSALEVYGEDGKNGVIMITSKKKNKTDNRYNFKKADVKPMPIDYNIVAVVIGNKLVSKTELESLKPEQIKAVHNVSDKDELKKLQTKFNTSKEFFMVIELK